MQNGRPLSENCVWSQAEKMGLGSLWVVINDDKVKLEALR